MRWDQLFAELEAAFEAEVAADAAAEHGSRARSEMGAVRLVDRVRGAAGHVLRVRCRGVGEVTGRLVDTGVDWWLLVDDQGRELLVATSAVLAVRGLGAETAAAEPPSTVARSLDLRRAVRGLARDRAPVLLRAVDGGVLAGTVDRVGADYVELAEHPVDQPRRRGAVRAVHAVPLAAIAVVVSGGGW